MDDIGSIARAGFGGGQRSEYSPPPVVPQRRHRRRDRVDLTDPHRATLTLLRERVLAATRSALELPAGCGPGRSFSQVDAPTVDAFLGRLLSDQNLLAAGRRRQWPAPRVDAALHAAMEAGVESTLALLDELGQLDGESWRLLCDVLDEFGRKVTAVSE